MAGTTCDPPPRTFRRFPSQPRLSPVHGGLTVLAHTPPPRSVVPASGLRHPRAPRPPVPGRHPYAGRRHTRLHQVQRGVQARRPAVPKVRVVPQPPLACCAPVPLPFPALAAVPPAAGTPLLQPRHTGHFLPSAFLPGVFSDDTGSACSTAAVCLTRAPFRRCGMHARTRGSRRRTIPPHHTPSVPWGAASRRLPPGRCGARGAHCSGALDFPGFLGSHACPDPRSHAIDRGRIPGLATRPCGRGPAAVPSRTRGRAPTQH